MKDRTAGNSGYNKNRKKITSSGKETCSSQHHPKIDNNINNDNNQSVSASENHRHVFIGPSNVGKTDYMVETLEKNG